MHQSQTGDEDPEEKKEEEGKLPVMPLIAPILFSPASSCRESETDCVQASGSRVR
jgi:hypothetical protein